MGQLFTQWQIVKTELQTLKDAAVQMIDRATKAEAQNGVLADQLHAQQEISRSLGEQLADANKKIADLQGGTGTGGGTTPPVTLDADDQQAETEIAAEAQAFTDAQAARG